MNKRFLTSSFLLLLIALAFSIDSSAQYRSHHRQWRRPPVYRPAPRVILGAPRIYAPVPRAVVVVRPPYARYRARVYGPPVYNRRYQRGGEYSRGNDNGYQRRDDRNYDYNERRNHSNDDSRAYDDVYDNGERPQDNRNDDDSYNRNDDYQEGETN